MKFVNTFKYIFIIALVAGLIVLIYHLFLKEEIIGISSKEISELINMDVSFERYDLFDGSTLVITGLTIKSPYPKDQYKEVNEHHADWISARIGKVRLKKFDYDKLIANKRFFASSIEIDSAEIDVYRDKTLPEPPYKHKPLLASILKSAGADIALDTLHLRRINIRYFEKTKHSPDPGRISFENLHATGYNLTNDSARIAENPNLTLDVQSDLMGEAQIKAHVVFDLTSENDFFLFSADVAPFQATALNTVITGVLPAKITDGQVKEMTILFEGNEGKASGTVDFQYEDIRFELFDDESSGLKSLITTEAAKLAMKKNNLKDKNNYEQGQIAFERRKDRFIFNYWWNSLKTGIVDAMLSDAGKLFNLDEKAKETPKN